MLTLVDISRSIGTFELKNINISVDKGDYFVLVGVSGAGKTMILEMIAGLVKPDSGNISLNNKEILNLPVQNRKVGIVYQSQTLFPHMTVFENIAFPLKSKKLKKEEIKKQVHLLAEETEVTHLLNRNPQSLSGGEAQRVAIARTLASDPDILLLDEPLSFLDIQLKRGISSLLRKINRKGLTIIQVTHDYEEAISLANKIAIIENGTIIQSGTPHDVFLHPKSEFVANFVGIKNFYSGILKNSIENHNLKLFETSGITIYTLAEEKEETEGHIIISGENITISENYSETSAINNFQGIVNEIIPIKHGLEIIIDIGIEIAAQISHLSCTKLKIELGKKVWVQFKASSVKFIKP